jgi:hypothetical protein
VQDEIAALSAVDNVDAVAPPVPSFAIAAMASAGIVSEDWDVAPASTVAIFVVLRTDACADARRNRKDTTEKECMMVNVVDGQKIILNEPASRATSMETK